MTGYNVAMAGEFEFERKKTTFVILRTVVVHVDILQMSKALLKWLSKFMLLNLVALFAC